MKIAWFFAAMVMAMSAALASSFTLSSPTLTEGGRVPQAHVYNGFGYTGKNLSPALHWAGAPAGTQSFAVTVFDPDAPHKGGWWHWLVLDIPASASGLPQGGKPGRGLPPGAIQIENDFGIVDYGGPAPPPGKAHRYVFTVYALNVATLGLDPYTPPAAAKAALEKAALAKASLTGLFAH